ncbi:hypothetical protein STEG23_011850, partial [Scotinomys teguina]
GSVSKEFWYNRMNGEVIHSPEEERSVEGKMRRSGLHLLFVGPVRFYLGVLSELRSVWLTTKFLAEVQGLKVTSVHVHSPHSPSSENTSDVTENKT